MKYAKSQQSFCRNIWFSTKTGEKKNGMTNNVLLDHFFIISTEVVCNV